MGARQSTYRTRDLTQAIVGIRRAGLRIRQVEIDRAGKITVHISKSLLEGRLGKTTGERTNTTQFSTGSRRGRRSNANKVARLSQGLHQQRSARLHQQLIGESGGLYSKRKLA